MRFLADQDVYYVTVEFLRRGEHDVVTARQIGMSRSTDVELLTRAAAESRIFVTRDKDFGSLVFVQSVGKGVIYLRVTPAIVDLVHEELAQVLRSYSEADLVSAFVVIEAGRHRFRKRS